MLCYHCVVTETQESFVDKRGQHSWRFVVVIMIITVLWVLVVFVFVFLIWSFSPRHWYPLLTGEVNTVDEAESTTLLMLPKLGSEHLHLNYYHCHIIVISIKWSSTSDRSISTWISFSTSIVKSINQDLEHLHLRRSHQEHQHQHQHRGTWHPLSANLQTAGSFSSIFSETRERMLPSGSRHWGKYGIHYREKIK